jgi:Spy/CpxP family protein refolding chaperone
MVFATGTLAAEEPQPIPTPDPALQLSPWQDREIQKVNDYFDQNEKPLLDALQKARADYKVALRVKPLNEADVQKKAAAVQKASTLLATVEALHRANILNLLTPEQQRIIQKMVLTGNNPPDQADAKPKKSGH